MREPWGAGQFLLNRGAFLRYRFKYKVVFGLQIRLKGSSNYYRDNVPNQNSVSCVKLRGMRGRTRYQSLIFTQKIGAT